MRSGCLLATCTLAGAIVCLLACAPYLTAGRDSDQKTTAVTALLINVGALGGFAFYGLHRRLTKPRANNDVPKNPAPR